MLIVISIIHFLVSMVLIMVVLLQTGKGADIGAAFGGTSQTLFGTRGPGTFLGKVTAATAVIFMVTSLSLAYMSARRPITSVMPSSLPASKAPATAGQPPTGPAAPGAKAPAAPAPAGAPSTGPAAPAAPAAQPPTK